VINEPSAMPHETEEAAPLLQTPTDKHLGVILSMFIRDGRDGGVIKHPLLSPDERTVRLHDDTVLSTIIYNLSLLAKRMKLTQGRGSE
jgi:hypothetical protein